ncbi:MAG: hypothetical protein P1V20_27000 [Verrucomicrobiales bacterium]|nr:hypothetical protein [Verrucomicrobiales bacterium]
MKLRLRPKFVQTVALAPEAVQSRIASHFREGEFRSFEVKQFPGFTAIRIPEEDRHFWSPRLNLSISNEERDDTLIEGLYGPNANVWALLLFGYLMLGFGAIIGGIVAYVQYAISRGSWGVWVFGASTIGLVLLYLIARMGRTVGERQVLRIHRAYEKAIGEPIAIR